MIGSPHFMVLMSIVVPLVHWLVKTTIRHFSKDKTTEEFRVCYPPAVLKFVKDSGWVPRGGYKSNSDTDEIRISRRIKPTFNEESKTCFEVVAPMQAGTQQVNNPNVTASPVSQWMKGATEFAFVGHSDYMMAIMLFSTINFVALCPNLTKAHMNGLITTTAFRTALAALQNLESLDIGMIIDDINSSGFIPHPLQHHNLKTLALRSNVRVSRLLRGMRLKNLEEFDLWLAPDAASVCSASNFSPSSGLGVTSCQLYLNFTPNEERFKESVKNYGIILSKVRGA